jgi:peptidoglycan/LPS O-acetylase OafA/YrhL
LNIKFTTKPNWLLLIVSVILFISVCLPWWTASYMGFTLGSISGFHSIGFLTFFMSLAGIALAFVDGLKNKAMITIGVGVLALLGTIVAFAVYSGSSMGFGRILALIFSIALIVVGYLDLRGIDVIAKIKASQAKSTPPPPPPPPPASPPPTPPSNPPPAQP